MGKAWKKTLRNLNEIENHLVDPNEKAENADSSEKVTAKRYGKYITPNNRLTIFVQQSAANTRLYESCGCYSGGRVSNTSSQISTRTAPNSEFQD